MKVIWAQTALTELRNIYDHYLENVSYQMAENIRVSVLESARQIGINPMSGISETRFSEGLFVYRSVVRGHYKIIYRIENDVVNIVDVFDTRQHPSKLSRNF